MPKFLSSVASTVVAGVILAILFFLVGEKLFPIPNVSGKWNVISKTNESTYSKYKDMELKYTVTLWSEGPKIHGTSEKVYENSSKGAITYTGSNRTRGEISGVVERRYFSKDIIKLHTSEQGAERESTIYYDLVFRDENRMTGTFFSTAADSKGTVDWQRDES